MNKNSVEYNNNSDTINVNNIVNTSVHTCNNMTADTSYDNDSIIDDDDKSINDDVKVLWYHKIQFFRPRLTDESVIRVSVGYIPIYRRNDDKVIW